MTASRKRSGAARVPMSLIQETGRGRELIDAAAKIFHDQGYAAASIQDVADELGILKGSVYHYISSKEDLLYAVIEEVHLAALAVVERCKALDGVSVPERLHAFIAEHIALTEKEKIKVTVFLRDFDQLGAQRQRQVRHERDLYAGFVESLVAQGQRDGIFRDDLDPKLVMRGLLGMLNWASRWIRPGRPAEAAEVAETFFALFVDGMNAPVAAKTRKKRS